RNRETLARDRSAGQRVRGAVPALQDNGHNGLQLGKLAAMDARDGSREEPLACVSEHRAGRVVRREEAVRCRVEDERGLARALDELLGRLGRGHACWTPST